MSNRVAKKKIPPNVCPHCGAEDTLVPYFFGKKRVYKCSKCGAFKGGKLEKGKLEILNI